MVFPAKYEATMVERMFLLPSSRNSTEARAGALVSLAGKFHTSTVGFAAEVSHSCSSVHNTRIERLWYDVTSGFGQKWKNVFIELETHCHLNASDRCHLWLLHFLFKAAINQDTSDWVQTWNHLIMQIKGKPS